MPAFSTIVFAKEDESTLVTLPHVCTCCCSCLPRLRNWRDLSSPSTMTCTGILLDFIRYENLPLVELLYLYIYLPVKVPPFLPRIPRQQHLNIEPRSQWRASLCRIDTRISILHSFLFSQMHYTRKVIPSAKFSLIRLRSWQENNFYSNPENIFGEDTILFILAVPHVWIPHRSSSPHSMTESLSPHFLHASSCF